MKKAYIKIHLYLVLINLYILFIQDKARFSDTSWQIHRTWSRNGDPLRLSPPPMRQDTTISSAATTASPLRNDQNGIYDTITVRANIIYTICKHDTSVLTIIKDAIELNHTDTTIVVVTLNVTDCYVFVRLLNIIRLFLSLTRNFHMLSYHLSR